MWPELFEHLRTENVFSHRSFILNIVWNGLQVTWDEPDLLQNVKRVSPWLVELVSNTPAVHLAPFSPPRKKLRIPHHPDFPLDAHQLPPPPFTNHPYGSSLCCLPQESTPAGIQGTRHAQNGISLSDLHLNKLQSGLFHTGFHHRFDRTTISPPPKFTTSLFVSTPSTNDDISCLLTIGSPATSKPCNEKKPPTQLVLFGQPILTEQQISLSSSGNSSSDGNNEKGANLSSSDGSALGSQHQNGGENSPAWFRDQRAPLELETRHCKVFMESEDVGRSLDLTVFGSYEELYRRLADMFGIEKSEIVNHLPYCDAAGAVKHTGDAPFTWVSYLFYLHVLLLYLVEFVNFILINCISWCLTSIWKFGAKN